MSDSSNDEAESDSQASNDGANTPEIVPLLEKRRLAPSEVATNLATRLASTESIDLCDISGLELCRYGSVEGSDSAPDSAYSADFPSGTPAGDYRPVKYHLRLEDVESLWEDVELPRANLYPHAIEYNSAH